MMIRLISAFCFLLISATPVFADQCTWLPGYAQAGNAFMFLKEGETIYEYCAPCGDTVARPMVVKQLKVRKVPIEPPRSELQDVPEYKTVAFLLGPPRSNDSQGEGTDYYEVAVNDKGIDLAYIYIPFEGGYRISQYSSAAHARMCRCSCRKRKLIREQAGGHFEVRV